MGVAMVLNYPNPKNLKELRHFLTIPNFLRTFIIMHVEFVTPLFPLLKKGVLWKWTAELQRTFETLAARFANCSSRQLSVTQHVH